MLTAFRNILIKNILIISIILSVVIGIAAGLYIRFYTELNETQKSYFNFPGEIYTRALKLMLLPLIVSSLLSSIGMLGKKMLVHNMKMISVKWAYFVKFFIF